MILPISSTKTKTVLTLDKKEHVPQNCCTSESSVSSSFFSVLNKAVGVGGLKIALLLKNIDEVN